MTLEQKQDAVRRMTLEEYRSLPQDERVELIDGKVCALAAPTETHQRISARLFHYLDAYLFGKRCQLRAAPYDVYLEQEGMRPTVVQPDLLVFCDSSHLKENGYHGAPDFLIEILSESNSAQDTIVKLDLYGRSGVREYWIVDPANALILKYLFKNRRILQTSIYHEGDPIDVDCLENCEFSVSDIFALQ